jgi:cytochrome c oxidase assembly protein subunit 11
VYLLLFLAHFEEAQSRMFSRVFGRTGFGVCGQCRGTRHGFVRFKSAFDKKIDELKKLSKDELRAEFERMKTSGEFERLKMIANKNDVRAAYEKEQRRNMMTVAYYAASVIIAFGALSYAAVPLYRALCARTGFGGTPITDSAKFTPDRLVPVDRKRRIRVQFSSEVSAALPWQFKPETRQVYVLPGETALAFYKAKNVSDRDIIGMAAYTVVPERAAPYFSKIQCFCFEEQQLGAGEEVDMPVFFFIDPDYARDPALANVDDIILHYTFFKAKYNDSGVLSPVDTRPPESVPASSGNQAVAVSA